jgi:signal transduction histidine kinase
VRSYEHALVDSETGRRVVLLVYAVPVRGPGGAVVVAIASFTDVTARRAAEEHQRLLLAELSHRVKNTLAVVQGVANRSVSGERTLAEAREVLAKRLAALANAHSLLTVRE